ncbi:MAG: serine hydrolase domain-containing protein [Betaproteobacteria bacterium]
MRINWFCITAVLVIGTAHAAPRDDGAWLEAARARYNIPGLSIAIVQRDKPVQFYSVGLCNVKRAIPCTENLRFAIGSVTKPITGLLSATLAAEHVVDLDTPAIRYWSALKLLDDRASQITLRDLLTQQSGLGAVDWPYFWDARLTRQDFLDRLEFVPSAKPFRAGFAYSNANFVIAGKLLETATQSTWESLVKQRLLSPLGMFNSGFYAPDSLKVGAVGYGPMVAGRPEPFPYVSPAAIRPAGGLVTTASDFSRLLSMLLNEGKWRGTEIVPPLAIETFLSTGSSGKRGGYGLGVGFTRLRDQTVFHHLGSIGGYSAALLVLPGKWGAIVLTNRTGSAFPEGLSFALLDRHLGNAGDDTLLKFAGPPTPSLEAEAPKVSALPANALTDFTGTYRHLAWGDFTVEASTSLLCIRMGQFVAPLDYMGAESFSFQSAPGWERLTITFQRDGDRRVNGFAMDDGTNPAAQIFTKLKLK